MTHTAKGFSLIELMISIAIIAILASVSIPFYQDYILRTDANSALNAARPLQIHISEYASRFAALPADATILASHSGISITPEDYAAGKVASVTIGIDGKLTIQFAAASNTVPPPIAGKTFILIPHLATSGAVTWDTIAGTLEHKYLPKLK